ncbi:glycosyltransferase family 9 protein [Streptomyces sp. NPDC020403]|uniref:glycosyltransferase family 9 protein n=1 Tax=unclassified Streptomyces TaxID=2593676 RepID=UPI0033F47392
MPPPRTPSRPRVLVLRALGLGDLLAGVPALRAVRRAFPGHETVLAVPQGLRAAALATGAVDTVLPASAPGRGVPVLTGWTGEPPDLAIDLHGNGPESHDALAALRPRRLLSYARPDPAVPDPPRWRPDEHERERWCRFLRAYGIDAEADDVRLPPPSHPSPAPGAVVVHPGADAPARCWPAGRYAAVVRRLRTAGHRVVVTGGPGEEALTAMVAAGAGLGPEHVLAGGLPFGDLSALVAGAACLLSGDTGPAHLAVAHGTPSVTLFGPVPPHLWGPPPDPAHTVLWHPGPPGDPHGTTTDPALLHIGTDQVLTAVLEHTRQPQPDARPGQDERAEATGHV